MTRRVLNSEASGRRVRGRPRLGLDGWREGGLGQQIARQCAKDRK